MRVRILIVLAAILLTTVGCGGQTQDLPKSTVLLVEAREAIAAGDDQKAMAALNDSITSQPMVWSHLERAKLRLKTGDEQGALADCDAALKLSPEDPGALWLKGELQKPVARRFQGQFKNPPSSRK